MSNQGDMPGNVSVEGGGGFMDATYNPTNSTSETNSKIDNTITPVMITQLYQETPDTLVIGGKLVKVVCIVAIVRKIEHATTKNSYELEDETGTITASRWLNAEAPEMDCDVVVNKYARIHGSLREQAGVGRHLFILRATLVTKIAEVISHLMEVTVLALNSEAGDINQNGNKAIGDEPVAGLTEEQRNILEIVAGFQSNSANGIQRSEVKAQVPSHMITHVDRVLEFLASEGHIYTTCTDDYYKAT